MNANTKCKQIENSTFVMAINPEKETDKAIFVMVVNTSCGSNKMYWIPKSILKQNENSFILPSWYLSKNFNWIN